MKKLLPVLRPAALLGIGLIMAVLSAAVGTISVSPDMSRNDLLAAAQSLQTASPTPTATADASRIGSTDGIVLMGILIVAIVIMPVLLRRKNGAK